MIAFLSSPLYYEAMLSPHNMNCPLCHCSLEIDHYNSVSHADQDGNPVEENGEAIYCTNKQCKHDTVPVDESNSSSPLFI